MTTNLTLYHVKKIKTPSHSIEHIEIEKRELKKKFFFSIIMVLNTE